MIRLLAFVLLANAFISGWEAKAPKIRIDRSYQYGQYLLVNPRTDSIYRIGKNQASFRSRTDCQKFKKAYLTASEKRIWHCYGVDPD